MRATQARTGPNHQNRNAPEKGSSSFSGASADQQHDFDNCFSELESVIQSYIQFRECPIKRKRTEFGETGVGVEPWREVDWRWVKDGQSSATDEPRRVWIGKAEETDEHRVLGNKKVLKSRIVYRLTAEDPGRRRLS